MAVRLAARQVSELVLQRAARWLELLETDRFGSLVFHVVASANLAHLPVLRPGGGWVGLDAPAELFRPVRTLAISQSMRLPHETVRRRVQALETGGRLVVNDGGVAVAPDVLNEARAGAVWREDERLLLEACRAMAEGGYATAAEVAAIGPGALPPAVLARLEVDFQVRVLETFTALYGDLMDGTILAAVIAANVRHITQSVELSRLYAGQDQPPPDEQRRPAAVRALARDLQLPFETVRRRAATLVAEGRLRAVDEGLVYPAAALITEENLQNNIRLLSHMDRMLREIVRLSASA